MSTYESAPATQMLATFCACCSRPLLDAVSVEAGIGPVCREKHGYAECQGEPDFISARAALAVAHIEEVAGDDAHQVANMLVHRIACQQGGGAVLAMTNALRFLGYQRLAGRIAERLARVRLALEPDGSYALVAPYSEVATAAFRRVPGRRWDRERKVNVFPRQARPQLWAALKALYPGQPAMGPAGLFTIGGANG